MAGVLRTLGVEVRLSADFVGHNRGMNESEPPPRSDPAEGNVPYNETSSWAVKYRPEGWIVEELIDGLVVVVSGPHSARRLAEAWVRDRQ